MQHKYNKTRENVPPLRSQVSSLGPVSGQAIIEFCVGLIGIMAILVTLLQIVSITRARTEMMARARQQAGEDSLSAFISATDAEYIEDWEEGNDGVRYSADDTPQSGGNPTDVQTFILDYATSGSSGWDLLDTIDSNPLADLYNNSEPVTGFGLVNAEETASVTNNGAFQGLIYNSETIDFDVSVWMTATEGIY